ncbi:hypothetical protein BJ508DRAFT_367214 [Ascobolus immersus RN42]|uniref:Uncharacterized protein n=1 Tax=Ascobolus immersus RN42 TaxID=1160509 RepID=A0A3N4HE14_ASCIM|nr:hypothetical protein BJ508DRAFT_367214 [Ascobolus immersus RN42]
MQYLTTQQPDLDRYTVILASVLSVIGLLSVFPSIWMANYSYAPQPWRFLPSTTMNIDTYRYCGSARTLSRSCPTLGQKPIRKPPNRYEYPPIILDAEELDTKVYWQRSKGYFHIGSAGYGTFGLEGAFTVARDWPDATWTGQYLDGVTRYQARGNGGLQYFSSLSRNEKRTSWRATGRIFQCWLGLSGCLHGSFVSRLLGWIRQWIELNNTTDIISGTVHNQKLIHRLHRNYTTRTPGE